jgi:hypothetical protein
MDDMAKLVRLCPVPSPWLLLQGSHAFGVKGSHVRANLGVQS